MSAKSHSGRFSPTRPTRSPGSIPRAMSACATSRACSAYCSQGMDSHSPRRFRRRATFRGCMAARAKKVAGTLSCATGGALVRTIRREVGRPGGAFLLARRRLLAPLLSFEPLTDGMRLTSGKVDLAVLHTPGHSAGHICLSAESRVIAGDVLLEEISPNPLLEFTPDGKRIRTLPLLLGSLRRLLDLNPPTIFPGQ